MKQDGEVHKLNSEISRRYLYVSLAHLINAFCLSLLIIFLHDIDDYFYLNHPKIHFEIGGFFSFVHLACYHLRLGLLFPVIFIAYSWYYYKKYRKQYKPMAQE